MEKVEKATKVAVVHNGLFHADEVTAVALLRVFLNRKVEVVRVPHGLSAAQIVEQHNPDYVIDVGREYDGRKLFDHHQFSPEEVPLASAGLILKYLVEVEGVEVSDDVVDLVSFVDANDLGLLECDSPTKWTFSQAIKMFNADNIYGEEQEIAFKKAVNFMSDMLESLKRAAAEERRAAEAAASAREVMEGVLELPFFSKFWNRFINGTVSDAEAVIWFDENQGKWKAQTVPAFPGSFEPNGRSFEPVDPLPAGIDFVHKGRFFVVASDKEALLSYLREHMK